MAKADCTETVRAPPPNQWRWRQTSRERGTAALNQLSRNDADEMCAVFSQLVGRPIKTSFVLIPPFYADGGDEIRVGRNVFINQNCTFYN